ncbi:uncharacterized protein LOC129786801 [Lutzomyia longipalpis]|uniref:uncharacterized protein LOC129786801 n=1 Tax=Lutzomyia longipalpis TaxID=7200 RepID=UPI0024835B41|nr:uncharacterized protein LOC129786801 [Lutzomyia longipalpis]
MPIHGEIAFIVILFCELLGSSSGFKREVKSGFVTKIPRQDVGNSSGEYLLDYKTRYGLRYEPVRRRVDVFEDVEEFEESNEVNPEGRASSRLTQIFKYILARLGSLFRTYRASEAKGAGQQGLISKPGTRFLNLFNIVRFPNEPCSTSNPKKFLKTLNGTCYHEVECEQLGGVPIDNCASGFGVCCVFQLSCGGKTEREISYFENPGFPKPINDRIACTMSVKLLPGVQQVLLEFVFFELRPPVDGSCTDDQFIVSGNNLNSFIPIICGINTGQHMYVDVSDSASRMMFLSMLSAVSDARAFSVRITQLKNNLAPQNCLQYFTESSGIIQSFNYEDNSTIVTHRNPSYFNNLNYVICIRRNPGFCTISYSNNVNNTEEEFQLTNTDENGESIIPPKQAGAEIFNCADDYIAVNGIRLCGEKLNDGSRSEDFTKSFPVTDFSAGPMILPVRTNDHTVGRGFKLFYSQHICEIL